MKAIVFIGSNKSGSSRDGLRTSAQMGYYTVLLTNRKNFLNNREEFPEVNQMIYIENLFNRETIHQTISDLEDDQKQVAAVISFIDPFVSLAAAISSELGLVELSVGALRMLEDKISFREHLSSLPASPRFTIFHMNQSVKRFVEETKEDLPLVIKSPVSNGSKDVLLVHTVNELKEGLRHLRRKSPQTALLAEEFLKGPQYLVEVMVYQGEITIVAVIEQEILQGDRFIITGYAYPANITNIQYDKLETTVISILQQLELTNGTCHLEMRLIDEEWKLIEINPRMSGGAMNRIIFEGTGINLAKETIQLYLGKKPVLEKTESNYVYAKFLTVSSHGKLVKVTGKNRASSMEGVVDVYVKPRKGAILNKPSSLGDRYAYVIASSHSGELAKEIATKASNEIKFYLEPL